MDRIPQSYKKSSFGMKCIKYMLIIINVLYLVRIFFVLHGLYNELKKEHTPNNSRMTFALQIISFLMITGATTLKVIFGEYYFELWAASTIDSLSSLWIATGCFLLALSIFGIAAAVKESTMMTNFVSVLASVMVCSYFSLNSFNLQYGLFLSLIFILQMAAAITGFTLITQTDGIVRESLSSMMYQSQWSSQSTMDWVQQTVCSLRNYQIFHSFVTLITF